MKNSSKQKDNEIELKDEKNKMSHAVVELSRQMSLVSGLSREANASML